MRSWEQDLMPGRYPTAEEWLRLKAWRAEHNRKVKEEKRRKMFKAISDTFTSFILAISVVCMIIGYITVLQFIGGL